MIGPLRHDDAEPSGDAPRLSPGQVERHYAPRAALELLTHEQMEALVVRWGGAAPARVGVITLSDVLSPGTHVVRLEGAADEYARGLYAALHQLDDARCERILVEMPPDTPEWTAVRDRLRRAAH